MHSEQNMPGVPSGRGCDACRKQKKKCDTVQPACSRCKRLGLNCIGGGQRRYKFIQIEERTVAKQQQASPESQAQAITKLGRPPFALTNEATRLSSSFAFNLEVKDPRFDLSCYGIFLPEVPKRLGSHPALDASASALMSAYPCVYNRQPSREALSKYGRALRVLRLSLDTPDSIKIIETLCAIYFLLICQSWIARPGDQFISHGKAVSSMLDAVAGKFTMKDLGQDFEHHVLISMCMVVIIEGLFDPTVRLHPWYRSNMMGTHGPTKVRSSKDADKGGLSDGLPQNSMTIETMARVPDFVHAPRTNLLEIQDLYRRACLDVEELTTRKCEISQKLSEGKWASITTRAIVTEKILPVCHTAHGVLLAITLGCNAILSALHPWDISLAEDNARFCDDVLSLSEQVSPYRPLGASHLPLCLVTAYLAVADPVKKEILHSLLVDYQEDISGACWVLVAEAARETYMAARLTLFEKIEHDLREEVDRPFECEDVSLCAVQ